MSEFLFSALERGHRQLSQHLVEMVKHKEYTQYRTFLRVGEAAKLHYYKILSQAGHKGLLGSGLVCRKSVCDVNYAPE